MTPDMVDSSLTIVPAKTTTTTWMQRKYTYQEKPSLCALSSHNNTIKCKYSSLEFSGDFVGVTAAAIIERDGVEGGSNKSVILFKGIQLITNCG